MPFVYAVEAFSLVRRPLAFTSFRTPIHKRLRLELDFHRERDLKCQSKFPSRLQGKGQTQVQSEGKGSRVRSMLLTRFIC